MKKHLLLFLLVYGIVASAIEPYGSRLNDIPYHYYSPYIIQERPKKSSFSYIAEGCYIALLVGFLTYVLKESVNRSKDSFVDELGYEKTKPILKNNIWSRYIVKPTEQNLDFFKQLYNETIQNLLLYTQNPEEYSHLKEALQHGILLSGDIGQIFLQSIINSTSSPSIKVEISDIVGSITVDRYFYPTKATNRHESAHKVSGLFSYARQLSADEKKPCLIMIQDFGILAEKPEKDWFISKNDFFHNNDYINQMIEIYKEEFAAIQKQIIDEIIKCNNDPNSSVIVLAVTSYDPEKILTLFKYHELFTKQQSIFYDKSVHIELLNILFGSLLPKNLISISSLAEYTAYYFNEYNLHFLKKNLEKTVQNTESDQISIHNLFDAIDEMAFGPEYKPSMLHNFEEYWQESLYGRSQEEEKRITAYHEAGHALINILLDCDSSVEYVSIIRRKSHYGLTRTIKNEQENNDMKILYNKICYCMAGEAAEELIFSYPFRYTTDYTLKNCSDKSIIMHDYAAAEYYIKLLFEKYQTSGNIFFIIHNQYQKAKTLLKNNISKLHAIAQALIEKQRLSREEINLLIENC